MKRLVFSFWSGSKFDDGMGKNRFGFMRYLDKLLYNDDSFFNCLLNNFGISCKVED